MSPPPPCGWCETTRSADCDRWHLLQHGRTPTGILPDIVKAQDLQTLAGNLRDTKPLVWHRAVLYPNGLLPRGGVRTSAGRIPRGTPPPLAAAGRDSHQDTGTGTQTSTFCEYPAEPCAPASPLRSYLHVPDVPADGGVVRTDHHGAGERSGSTQQYDLKAHHASVGGW
jgi:hypothetical protein